jgi:hypothetical protein
MGNRLSCLNRDDNIDNIIKRKDELNDEDFYIVDNNYNGYISSRDNNFRNNQKIYKKNKSISFKKKDINYQQFKDEDKSDKSIICSLDNLKRSQIMKLKQILEYFHQNGKPRSCDDFDPNNWKKFYSENNTYFYNKDKDIIHNQLKIYNPNDINNIRIYQGDLNKLGQRHGIGKYTTPYYVLIGMWKKDKFNGWGRESRCNGDVFEGKFVNGLINGKGFFMDINKNRYVGDFINVKRWGKGKWFTDKISYEGEFYNNKIHGNGRIKFLKSGIEYIGTFKNDKIDGYGIFKWLNGDKYEGEVKNGKMHGIGKYQYSNGQIFNGTFINGKIGSKQESYKTLKNGNKRISPIKYDYLKDEYIFDNAFFNKLNDSKKINSYNFKNNNTYNNYKDYSWNKRQKEMDYNKTFNNYEISNVDFSKSLRNRKNNYYLKKYNHNNTYFIGKDNRDYLINNNLINEQFPPIQENTEYAINNYDFVKTSKFKRSGYIENENSNQYFNEDYNFDNKYILDEFGIFDDNKTYENNNNNNNFIDFEKYLAEDNILYNDGNLKNKNNGINEMKQININYNMRNFENFNNNQLNNGLRSNKREYVQNNININENIEKPEIKEKLAPNILLSTYRNYGFGDDNN